MLWKNKLIVLHLILFRAKSRWKHSFVRFKFGTVAIQTKWFLYFLLSKTSVWLCFHSSNSVRKQWIYWTSRHVDTGKNYFFFSVIGRFQHLLNVVKCFETFCRSILLRLHQIFKTDRSNTITIIVKRIFAECWSNGKVWNINLLFSCRIKTNKCVCRLKRSSMYRCVSVNQQHHLLVEGRMKKTWIKGWNCTKQYNPCDQTDSSQLILQFSAPFSFSSLHTKKNKQ